MPTIIPPPREHVCDLPIASRLEKNTLGRCDYCDKWYFVSGYYWHPVTFLDFRLKRRIREFLNND